jgi:hypothetical protein
MKVIKNLVGMFFMIGMPFPIFFPDTHYWYFGFVGLLSAFIGSGITFGFNGYKVAPKKIGNLDGKTEPIINQVWMMFFISAVVNLLFASSYIN